MRSGAPDDTENRLAAAFASEAARRVAAMNRDLLALQGARGRGAAHRLLETLVREAHTLKGAADAAGLTQVRGLADRLESLFERLRRGEAEPQSATYEAVFRALDAMLVVARDPTAALAASDVAAIAAELDGGVEGGAAAPSAIAADRGSSGGVAVATPKLEALLATVGELIAANTAIQRRLTQLADELGDLVTSASSPAGERVEVSPARDRKAAVVLLAENSETTRALQQHLLEHAGYEVRPASDGVEAWNLLQDGAIDVVISDILMPGIDGFQLTARIRADQRLRHLPVVLITSTDSAGRRERGDEVGASAYLVKGSAEYQDMIETVQRLLAVPPAQG